MAKANGPEREELRDAGGRSRRQELEADNPKPRREELRATSGGSKHAHATSGSEKTNPTRDRPNVINELSPHMKLRNERKEATLKKLTASRHKPDRESARGSAGESRLDMSTTEGEKTGPGHAMPEASTAKPKLAVACTDKGSPDLANCSAGVAVPMRPMR